MPGDALLTVVLTSNNSAKVDAVKSVFPVVLAQSIHVINVDAPSDISATPIGDDEAIKGCRNRIDAVRHNHVEADFIVGLEGVIERTLNGTFVFGWALVEENKSGRQGLGCSAKVMLPPVIAKQIEARIPLSELVSDHYRLSAAHVAQTGTNGVVTRGLFSRRDEFEGALLCALGFLLNDRNFN